MSDTELLPPEELERRLRAIGEERYHILHPFHHLLHGGRLSKPQVQAWALNRYYYQASIPAKDAAVLGRLPTPELRREWRRRIVDHDGDGVKPGGVERWLKLTDGL
ncbi:MAG: pyrroloquinoline quinone biosynthesis protein C, partial [Paracraurococcus sp.]